jgi:hypothetical protein
MDIRSPRGDGLWDSDGPEVLVCDPGSRRLCFFNLLSEKLVREITDVSSFVLKRKERQALSSRQSSLLSSSTTISTPSGRAISSSRNANGIENEEEEEEELEEEEEAPKPAQLALTRHYIVLSLVNATGDVAAADRPDYGLYLLTRSGEFACQFGGTNEYGSMCYDEPEKVLFAINKTTKRIDLFQFDFD